ncbi:class I SAM-dependent methyltransferase [Alishewanella sp. SMS8]|uniref:class I SAM-dependent methyltransferase n=1 Tax=Alishewanella sp. SMS8 TaxID=2994676 RepID=UPI0027427DA9|nr:methyltransferase [Alishewanella sp. SMS8]MDP5207259.1 methyltransferase [Alishewanella sp. SMS9]MDP5459496.1 methyltransferase [Alishewanella sp. SMS8]
MLRFSKILSLTALLCSLPLAANEALETAVKNPLRTPEYLQRDQYRNPVATLAFFDVTPQSTVVEISPGGGWYTEIIAPLVAEKGMYYAAHFPANSSEYGQRSRKAFIEKMASQPQYSKVQVTEFSAAGGVTIAPANSADVVLTFRNLHNWYIGGGEDALVAAYKQFFTALKPGGVLGVVEHRLPESQLNTEWTRSGYMPQSMAVRLAEQAGFVFEGSSEINANAKDTANHPSGVWTLPPTLRLGEQDRAKYQAIGESDRMTLKFRKPLN